jgi:putative hydrolase of the HAD superfamily
MIRAALRGVLFDAVGTLLGPAEPVGATYARLAAEHGAPVPASRLEEAFARCRAAAGPVGYAPGLALERAAALERAWWRRLVEDTFRTADGARLPRPFDAFFERLFAHYGAAAAWRLAPGAAACLLELRARGLATGVVSNFDHRLRGVLRGLEIHHLLDVVVLPAEVGAAKPARAIFDAALKRLGLAGHQVAFIGNDPDEDLAGARAAGLRAVDAGGLATLRELPAALGLRSRSLATEPR